MQFETQISGEKSKKRRILEALLIVTQWPADLSISITGMVCEWV